MLATASDLPAIGSVWAGSMHNGVIIVSGLFCCKILYAVEVAEKGNSTSRWRSWQ